MTKPMPATEVVITGVCASGKTTLANELRRLGYAARTVAQEHSCIPELWSMSGAPVTIYLHASFEAVTRRGHSLMTPYNYEAQLHRLRRAREGSTIRVDTTDRTPEEVLSEVLNRMPATRRSEPRQAT